MMRYKEAIIPQEINLGDPFQRIHKLRPLIPNPYISSTSHNNSYLNHLHNHHHDFGNKGLLEESCKEGSAQQVMVSSRWNPTPEQLTALEELYRCGTRTPSAEQIQHITSQLRRYGKIEGKNVFYWFQNHKARERQKRRRQHQLHVTTTTSSSSHANDNKGFEDEEKNCKRAPFINNNKESNNPPIQSTAGPKTADMMTSSDKLFEFHQISAEFQHNYYPNNTFCTKKDLFLSEQRNATWPTQVNNSQPSSNNYSHAPLQLFSLSSKLNSSSQEPRNHSSENVVDDGGDRGEPTVALTLQLFPLVKQSNGEAQFDDIMDKSEGTTKENIISCMVSDDFIPYYQFL